MMMKYFGMYTKMYDKTQAHKHDIIKSDGPIQNRISELKERGDCDE